MTFDCTVISVGRGLENVVERSIEQLVTLLTQTQLAEYN